MDSILNYFILFAPLFILGIAFIYLAIVVHEFGHLIFGLMSGYRFSSLRLFSLVWFKENGKIKFKVSKSITAGQCLMKPVSDEGKFRFILYNLGGGLLNLVFMGIAIAVTIALGNFNPILILFSYAQFCIALLGLVPMNFGAPNDAMNVLKAVRSKEAKHGMFLIFYVNSELMDGKRMRDFDDEIFAVSESADFCNHFVAYIVMCESARLYDMGEYDKSIEQYDRLNINNLQTFYRNSVNLDIIYYHIMHKPDYEKAKKIYADKKMKPYLKFNLPSVFRISAAYEYFINEDKEKSMIYLRKAEKATENSPNSGAKIMEKEYLRELEKRIESG